MLDRFLIACPSVRPISAPPLLHRRRGSAQRISPATGEMTAKAPHHHEPQTPQTQSQARRLSAVQAGINSATAWSAGCSTPAWQIPRRCRGVGRTQGMRIVHIDPAEAACPELSRFRSPPAGPPCIPIACSSIRSTRPWRENIDRAGRAGAALHEAHLVDIIRVRPVRRPFCH